MKNLILSLYYIVRLEMTNHFMEESPDKDYFVIYFTKKLFKVLPDRLLEYARKGIEEELGTWDTGETAILTDDGDITFYTTDGRAIDLDTAHWTFVSPE